MVLKVIIFASISTLLVCGSGGNVLNHNRTVTTKSSSGTKTSVRPISTSTTPMTTDRTEKASSRSTPSENYRCYCHHNNYGNLVLSIPLTIVTLAFVFFVAWHRRRTQIRRYWSPVSTNDERVISNSTVASQEQLIEGDLTLEQLEQENLETFEWMCRMLDNGQRDYERLASNYQRITLDKRQALQNEFQTPGGSPSKALMKHLQALYPTLTLRDLLSSLTKIKRDDIVQGITKKLNRDAYDTVL